MYAEIVWTRSKALALKGFESFTGSQASSLNPLAFRTRHDAEPQTLIRIDASDYVADSESGKSKIRNSQRSVHATLRGPQMAEIDGRKARCVSLAKRP